MSKSETARLYGSSIFSFVRKLQSVPIVVASIYIPTNSVGRFPFLHTLSSAGYF